jgi:formate-nitrite transporter family protein
MPSPTAQLASDTSRRTAADIFQDAVRVGEEELKRSSPGLAFSGLAAGLGMGLTGLGSAALLAALHGVPHAELIATLLYPAGFIVVIVGRAQLFTENTLFPVILVLDRRRHLRNTGRLWAVVLVANIAGALLFALLAVASGALDAPITDALSTLGRKAAAGSFSALFWGGVAGGWIIALVAWLVSAARFTIAQIALIWLLTFIVGAAHLAHCIAGSGEILSAVVHGSVSPGRYLYWLAAATLGNAVGGVVGVSLLNYAQVIGSGHDPARADQSLDEVEDELSRRGRSARQALSASLGRRR